MDAIQLEDFAGFHFLSGIRLSPDGDHAAFAVHQADREKNRYRSAIWLWEAASGETKQLTSMGDERGFVWLDDRTLLFVSNRGEEKKGEDGFPETTYYTIPIDGGEGRKAFSVPLAVSRLEPLGKGTYLLLAGFDNSVPDLAGMSETEKTAAQKAWKEEQDYKVLDEIPYWGNGEGFLNKKRGRLYLYDSGDGALTPLTEPYFAAEDWDVSPDRTKIVYSGIEYRDRMPLTQGLYLRELSASEPVTLVEGGRFSISEPRFLPDGERIFFLGNEGKRCGLNENAAFYLWEKGGIQKFADPDFSLYNSVGNDCSYGGGNAFCVTEEGVDLIVTQRYSSRLCHVGWDGTAAFLNSDGGTTDCFDRKGTTCLFIGRREQKLQELYRLDPASGKEQAVTDWNGDVFRGKYVAVPQPLPFTNEDGVEIDGWVLLPRNYDPAKRYPGILDIHGGPKTVYGTVYYHEMQLWANKGYFVFFCNPRGGSGRGNAFSDIRGKYGAIDYDDLMEFTDRVLAAYPAIDPGRLGVTGGSYGGFMTNWIIGHTSRFAAAASQRSISNWISMCCTTDIGYYFATDQTAASPWEGHDRMWEQSPLKYADRCVTPTLFIHSDEDYRCWMAEGLQMFTALKMHGVEARLCLFHGENHELSRSGKPSHRIRRLTEITGWFDSHLK